MLILCLKNCRCLLSNYSLFVLNDQLQNIYIYIYFRKRGFAKKDFRAGEFLLEYAGECIHAKDAEKGENIH